MSGAAGRPTSRPALRGALYSLSFGHLCSDLTSGAVSALLPFLVVQRGYGYGDVGIFVMVASIAGGALQPLFGHFGDRTGARWLMPAGLLLGGLGIAAVGLVEAYVAALAAVAVANVGIAAFHPEGARWARAAAGSDLVSGMSVFSVGGGIGFALAPAAVTAAVEPLGLWATALLALPGAAAALAVGLELRRIRRHAPQHRPVHVPRAARRRDEWSPFARLAFMYGVLSAVEAGVMAYVPLFLISARGVGAAASNAMTTVFLVAAAAGTLLGGRLADRVGRRLVLVWPPLLLVPAIAVLPRLSFAAMVPLVFLSGLALTTGVSTAIVLAQEYLPDRVGLAAGLTVGMSVGIGGGGAALLGLLGDVTGPASVLYVLAGLPAAIAALNASLPRPAAMSPGARW